MRSEGAIEDVRTLEPAQALEALCEAWHPDYGSLSEDLSAHEGYVVHAERGGRYLRFTTGGWSENEELISAFQCNRLAWLWTWQLSARGGLYIFKVPGSEGAILTP